jgi:hypothetical protein
MVRIVVTLLALLSAALSGPAQAQTLATPSENAWMRTWIPVHCCVTNNCCFAIKASEVEPIPDDNWRVVATGQVLGRTNWSPDGKWYRCACDRIEGKWVVHMNANTRCIFPAMQSVQASAAN